MLVEILGFQSDVYECDPPGTNWKNRVILLIISFVQMKIMIILNSNFLLALISAD